MKTTAKTPPLKPDELERLYTMFLSNVYPSMVIALSEELGVTVDSINRLGVGYDYIEECWIFAERDERGLIVGLSRRQRDGSKFMVSGSKRGLIYECVGKIEKGRVINNDSFTRVRNAGVDCPICHKSDWCMVSNDDPHNPTAAICGRVEQGSIKHIEGSGYLHQLRTNGKVYTNTSVLPTSDKPYLVVEGASDVLAAMDLGYIGIGKPSAESGNILVAALLQGKSAVVFGENDAGAGVRGMERTFKQLKTRCKKVFKCLPPAIHKDLRRWLIAGLSIEELDAWIASKAVEGSTDNLIYGGLDFLSMAERFLRSRKTRLLNHHDVWWEYSQGKYNLVNEKTLASQVAKFFHGFEYADDDDKKVKDVKVNTYFTRELISAMCHHAISMVPNHVLEPCLINTGKQFDLSHLILFKNGMLDVMNDKLIPHSDNLFTTATLSYDYDPRAMSPRWITSVYEWLEGDEEQIALLQEWFGYNMTASNYLEQLMFVYGPSGSGKSTAQRVLQYLLDDNYMPMNTQQLCVDQFGLSSLVGKYACMVSEEGKIGHGKGQKLLSTLKQITGNDAMPIRRMRKEAVSGKLFCKITFTSNKLPVFHDETQALFRRYNLLNFGRTFKHNPNVMLYRELVAERQGIAVWAVEGLKRLLQNSGRFTQPAKSVATIEDLKIESSPIKSMFCDWIELGVPDSFVSRAQLYDLYLGICNEEYVKYPVSARSFRRVCDEAMPNLNDYEIRKHNMRGWIMAISPEAKKRYLGG